MKKGFYYIYTRKNNAIKVEKVAGYIIPDEKSGLTFGTRFRAGNGWEVTESSTGLLISYGEKKPKNAGDILPFIDRMREAVLSAMKSQAKYFEHIQEAIREAKENETR